MKRLHRALIRLYPTEWRVRYGDEFAAYLESAQPGLLDMLDVVRGAYDERQRTARRERTYAMNERTLDSGRQPPVLDRWRWAAGAAMLVYALINTLLFAAAFFNTPRLGEEQFEFILMFSSLFMLAAIAGTLRLRLQHQPEQVLRGFRLWRISLLGLPLIIALGWIASSLPPLANMSILANMTTVLFAPYIASIAAWLLRLTVRNNRERFLPFLIAFGSVTVATFWIVIASSFVIGMIDRNFVIQLGGLWSGAIAMLLTVGTLWAYVFAAWLFVGERLNTGGAPGDKQQPHSSSGAVQASQ
jgi:hypothetical protein